MLNLKLLKSKVPNWRLQPFLGFTSRPIGSPSMRLRAVTPALPDALISSLEECGIRTDADLMFSGTAMQLYEKLPQGTITLVELEKHIQDTIRCVSAEGARGDELLAQEEEKYLTRAPGRISSGIPELDQMIIGYNGPRVLEISGDHGSGKTVCERTGGTR